MEPELEARALWLRSGLILLATAGMVVGVWALLAPQSFYDDFPGGGRSWVSVFPPYNEHLVRDVGGLNLALAVLLVFAAIILERRLPRLSWSGGWCRPPPSRLSYTPSPT